MSDAPGDERSGGSVDESSRAPGDERVHAAVNQRAAKPENEHPRFGRWRLAAGGTRTRIARRSGSLLMIIGGLVLAYPFWSAAYTHFAQEQLATSYRAESSHFATQVERRKSTLAPATDAATRLRSLAALFAATLKPGDPIGHLVIPRLGMNRVILQGVGGSAGLTPGGDAPYLRSGPVHYGTTPLPGAGEPFAIAGHRTTFAAPFYNLNELRRGDQIFVDTPYARFTYTVSKLTTVLPTDVTVLYDRGYGLVLTTCTPRYSASHRLIAWAVLTGFRFQQ